MNSEFDVLEFCIFYGIQGLCGILSLLLNIVFFHEILNLCLRILFWNTEFRVHILEFCIFFMEFWVYILQFWNSVFFHRIQSLYGTLGLRLKMTFFMEFRDYFSPFYNCLFIYNSPFIWNSQNFNFLWNSLLCMAPTIYEFKFSFFVVEFRLYSEFFYSLFRNSVIFNRILSLHIRIWSSLIEIWVYIKFSVYVLNFCLFQGILNLSGILKFCNLVEFWV